MWPLIISAWLDPINNLKFYLWQAGHHEYQFTDSTQGYLPQATYNECLEDVEINILSKGYVKL